MVKAARVPRVAHNQAWVAHKAAASVVLKDSADKTRAPVVDKARVTWDADLVPALSLRAKASKVVILVVAAAQVPVTQVQAATRLVPAAVKVACNAFTVNC